MSYHRLLAITLCLALGACAGKPSTTSTAAGKPATTASLSQMNAEFLYLSAQDAMRHGQPELAIQFLEALVRKNPEARTPRLQLAELLLHSNRADRAIPHIDAVIGDGDPASVSTPEAAQPYILRARALAITGHGDEALDTLTTLLAGQPDLLNARLLHISILASLNRLDEAHASIAAGIRTKETPELRKIQADLLIRQNRLDEAVKSLEAMQKLTPDNPTPVLLMSQIALKQNDRVRSEQLLRDYIEQRPESILVRNALGRLLVQSGRMAEAITIYKGLVHDTGGTVEALSTLGLLYYETQDYENAADQFRKALKNSSDGQSRFYLAASLEALGRTDEAKKLYGEIDKKSAAYIDAQLRLAGLELASGNVAAAERRVRSILSKSKNSADAYMLLSSIQLTQKKFRRLLDETEPALNLPQISTRLLFNRAVAFEHFKQYGDVENSLKQLLSIDPKNAEALNFLGYIYAEQGIKLDEAETLIRRALEQKSDDGYYLDSLAWVYFQRGEYDQAIATQKQAIDQIGNDPVMYEHMGDMLWKRGRKDDARNNWKKALELKHDKPELIKKKIGEGLK